MLSTTRVHLESKDKDRSGSKHWDSKSPCKCTGSPAHGLPTTQGEKEPCLENPVQTFKASFLSHQLNDTDIFLELPCGHIHPQQDRAGWEPPLDNVYQQQALIYCQ